MYETIEGVFWTVVNCGILLVEIIGVVILLVTAVKALVKLFESTSQCKHLLAEGITTALSFLLASEVMKTIVAPDWKDIGMTCAILVMRAGMTLLIAWEKKHED